MAPKVCPFFNSVYTPRIKFHVQENNNISFSSSLGLAFIKTSNSSFGKMNSFFFLVENDAGKNFYI